MNHQPTPRSRREAFGDHNAHLDDEPLTFTEILLLAVTGGLALMSAAAWIGYFWERFA